MSRLSTCLIICLLYGSTFTMMVDCSEENKWKNLDYPSDDTTDDEGRSSPEPDSLESEEAGNVFPVPQDDIKSEQKRDHTSSTSSSEDTSSNEESEDDYTPIFNLKWVVNKKNKNVLKIEVTNYGNRSGYVAMICKFPNPNCVSAKLNSEGIFTSTVTRNQLKQNGFRAVIIMKSDVGFLDFSKAKRIRY
eukprot:759279_1